MVSKSPASAPAFDECDRMFSAVEGASSLAEACHALTPLFDVYETINVELAGHDTYWRARKYDSAPWPKIAQMSYPPGPGLRPGRLNDEHAPCFYAATGTNTALAEIDVKPGDFVQIAGFRLKPGAAMRVAVVGEMFHVHKMGYLRLTGTDPGGAISRLINEQGLDRGGRTLYIDAFLASLLADRDAHMRDYVLSRAIASMIHRIPDIDGVVFPSVRDTHGMNLALKPHAVERSIRAVCCIHARVSHVRRFWFVGYEMLSDAESVSAGGDLLWLPAQKGLFRCFNLTKEEHAAGLRGEGIAPF